jgi:hypothetical protein
VAGISQVWLTEKELTALDNALQRFDDEYAVRVSLRPHFASGHAKIKAALEPVACKV